MQFVVSFSNAQRWCRHCLWRFLQKKLGIWTHSMCHTWRHLKNWRAANSQQQPLIRNQQSWINRSLDHQQFSTHSWMEKIRIFENPPSIPMNMTSHRFHPWPGDAAPRRQGVAWCARVVEMWSRLFKEILEQKHLNICRIKSLYLYIYMVDSK